MPIGAISFLHYRKDLVAVKCENLSYNVKTLREDAHDEQEEDSLRDCASATKQSFARVSQAKLFLCVYHVRTVNGGINTVFCS